MWTEIRCRTLTCLPNTGLATPHLHGDRSVGLNVKPPPAPGEMGSCTNSSLGLPVLDLSFECYIPPSRQQLWSTLCQTFSGLKAVNCSDLSLKLNHPAACCLCCDSVSAAAPLHASCDCQKQVVAVLAQVLSQTLAHGNVFTALHF